eukprot:scaffold278013_cov30-Tisochrysis_lutea.AAC.1
MPPSAGMRRFALAAGGVSATLSAWLSGGERREEYARSAWVCVRYLPSGLAGAVAGDASEPPVALERSVQEAITGAQLHLCGVCHVDVAARRLVRERAETLAQQGRLSLIAIEADHRTLVVVRAAAAALTAMPAEAVREQGVSCVRRALFEMPQVHEWAVSSGQTLESAEQVGLSSQLQFHLQQEGVLWGAEQAEAAEVATELGVDVACLRQAPPARASPMRGPIPLLTQAAYWLRCHSLQPGYNERSCDKSHVRAANAAMREVAPWLYRTSVEAVDAEMSAALRRLCEAVTAASGEEPQSRVTSGGKPSETGVDYVTCANGALPPPTILVVVGARHVDGMEEHLVANMIK